MGTAESIVERIELPRQEMSFLKAYASRHGMTLSSLLVQYASELRAADQHPPHPANAQFAGRVPADVDAREEYLQHMANKHK
jgi:hypothetical protein